LGKYYLKDVVGEIVVRDADNSNAGTTTPSAKRGHPSFERRGVFDCAPIADGSIIIVIATDAPVDARQLKRMAARSMSGLARTGSAMTNGSGDYAIAFSTANRIKIADGIQIPRGIQVLGNEAMSPLFLAVIEATEEAIYN
jgi:D-aminopeptidase